MAFTVYIRPLNQIRKKLPQKLFSGKNGRNLSRTRGEGSVFILNRATKTDFYHGQSEWYIIDYRQTNTLVPNKSQLFI